MNGMFHLSGSRQTSGRRMSSQRGVTLLVALVVLLVMTITGLALVRTSTLGAGVSGSLALKQAATSDADLGLEFGLAKLNALYDAGSILLGADNSTYSYYASVDPKTAAKDLPWTTALVAVAAVDNKLGNEVRYMIHRLCSQVGPANVTGQHCVMPQGLGCPGSSESAGSVQLCGEQPMYRVTAQVKGPRDTLSYVQMSFY